jgi:hypothetical protein
MTAPTPGTGLAGLDEVVRGLRPGDNVVWQVETVDDYGPLVTPFVSAARSTGRRIVYHRFARHPALVTDEGVEVHALDPSVGFESFTAAIHASIERAGRGACHVFDCLSELAADWCSDLMLGNFFRVTCPYLFELDTITYFAVLRDGHSLEAVQAIRSTTQLLVDVFRRARTRYVHPIKVDGRHSPTMYLPHAWEDGAFRPLTESAVLRRRSRTPTDAGSTLPRASTSGTGASSRRARSRRRCGPGRGPGATSSPRSARSSG